jgi:hypothetical protein
MFVGETVCILFYYGLGMKSEVDPKKENGGFKILAIPAFFDGITSSL